MKSKKIIIYVSLVCFGLVLAFLSVMGYSYYAYKSSLYPKNQPFAHSAHYINPKTALLSNHFKVCDSSNIAQYYNTQELPYPEGKQKFRDYIYSRYKNKSYKDSGYLNFRFIINCEGQVGRFVIHENDLNLNPKPFNTDLKNQLFKLTSEAKSWKPTFLREKNRDAYMYVSFRIEHGNITEIIP